MRKNSKKRVLSFFILKYVNNKLYKTKKVQKNIVKQKHITYNKHNKNNLRMFIGKTYKICRGGPCVCPKTKNTCRGA